jgi:hypothetical protein
MAHDDIGLWTEEVDGVDFAKFMPKWAIGEAHGLLQVGAQLSTRDGRKAGNAVIVSAEEYQFRNYKDILFKVLTDAGNTLTLNTAEVFELFYPPEYLMDVATAPGNRPTLEAQPCAYRHWSTEWHCWEVYSVVEVPANAPKDRQQLYATREG